MGSGSLNRELKQKLNTVVVRWGLPQSEVLLVPCEKVTQVLFICTGGFTREARYEAERSTFPLTLVDLDDLADLIVSHYESFDLEGRALIPLVRIYWPVD